MTSNTPIASKGSLDAIQYRSLPVRKRNNSFMNDQSLTWSTLKNPGYNYDFPVPGQPCLMTTSQILIEDSGGQTMGHPVHFRHHDRFQPNHIKNWGEGNIPVSKVLSIKARRNVTKETPLVFGNITTNAPILLNPTINNQINTLPPQISSNCRYLGSQNFADPNQNVSQRDMHVMHSNSQTQFTPPDQFISRSNENSDNRNRSDHINIDAYNFSHNYWASRSRVNQHCNPVEHAYQPALMNDRTSENLPCQITSMTSDQWIQLHELQKKQLNDVLAHNQNASTSHAEGKINEPNEIAPVSKNLQLERHKLIIKPPVLPKPKFPKVHTVEAPPRQVLKNDGNVNSQADNVYYKADPNNMRFQNITNENEFIHHPSPTRFYTNDQIHDPQNCDKNSDAEIWVPKASPDTTDLSFDSDKTFSTKDIMSPSKESIMMSVDPNALRKHKDDKLNRPRKRSTTNRPLGIYGLDANEYSQGETIRAHHRDDVRSTNEDTTSPFEVSKYDERMDVNLLSKSSPPVKLRKMKNPNLRKNKPVSCEASSEPSLLDDASCSRRNTVVGINSTEASQNLPDIQQAHEKLHSQVKLQDPDFQKTLEYEFPVNKLDANDDYGVGDFMLNSQNIVSPNDFRYSFIIEKQNNEDNKTAAAIKTHSSKESII